MPLGDGLKLEPLAPKEAVDFFRKKGYAIGFDYRDVWQAEHQTSFTVAKAMQVDLLRDIRGALDQAIAQGTTLETFQQQLKPLLIDKGWWGRTTVTDPQTGEDEVVQLGSPRRLKVIYDTNLRQAYKEGQWQRIQASQDIFPLLWYDGLNSEHPRQSHVPFNNLLLPANDPFWRVHMPQCAWGCKCRAVQMDQHMADAQGIKVGTAPQLPSRPYVNARTGEVQQIPYGVDPEFHYPPALPRNQAVSKALFDKMDQMDARTAGAVYPTLDATSKKAMADEYGAWLSKLPAGEEVQQRRVVAAVPPRVLGAAGQRGAGFDSAMVAAWAPEVTDLAKLAPEVAGDLPALLAKPLAIRWDAGRRQLVYTVPGQGNQVAIAIQLGRKLPGGGSENRIVRVFQASQAELQDLDLLAGEP